MSQSHYTLLSALYCRYVQCKHYVALGNSRGVIALVILIDNNGMACNMGQLFQYIMGGIEENHENLSHDRCSLRCEREVIVDFV